MDTTTENVETMTVTRKHKLTMTKMEVMKLLSGYPDVCASTITRIVVFTDTVMLEYDVEVLKDEKI